MRSSILRCEFSTCALIVCIFDRTNTQKSLHKTHISENYNWMSCCCCINNCFKILLWMFSVLIFFLGCALIVIPLVIFYDQSFTSVEDFVEQYIPVSDLEIFTWVIVGIGALTLIISFLGCGAAHSNHKCGKIAGLVCWKHTFLCCVNWGKNLKF